MITRFDCENLVKNLPDAYRKTADSNNHKILMIERREMDRIRDAIRAIYESLDIEKATGNTLDLYGQMVGQDRGKANDDQYRILIKSRIIRNITNGDYNSVVNMIALVFGCKTTDIVITESEETPCVVSVSKLPFDTLNNLSISIGTALNIMKELMPAGVKLDSVSFTGTFEFGGTDLEEDTERGFADEAQTIGGYFGMVFVGDEIDMPVA